MRGLIRAWHAARDAGQPAIPPHIAEPLLREFRHAVLAGLSSVPRIPGPKNTTAQRPGRDLLAPPSQAPPGTRRTRHPPDQKRHPSPRAHGVNVHVPGSPRITNRRRASLRNWLAISAMRSGLQLNCMRSGLNCRLDQFWPTIWSV